MQGHIVLKPSSNLGTTVSSSTVSFTTIPTDVVGGILTIETNDVRMRHDGTDPARTGLDGAQLMKKDGIWEITGRDILVSAVFIAPGDDAFVTLMCLVGE
jgi:hypothetical protein